VPGSCAIWASGLAVGECVFVSAFPTKNLAAARRRLSLQRWALPTDREAACTACARYLHTSLVTTAASIACRRLTQRQAALLQADRAQSQLAPATGVSGRAPVFAGSGSGRGDRLNQFVCASPRPTALPQLAAGQLHPSPASAGFGYRDSCATGSSRTGQPACRRSFYYRSHPTRHPAYALGYGAACGHRAADLRNTQLRSSELTASSSSVWWQVVRASRPLAQRPGATPTTGA